MLLLSWGNYCNLQSNFPLCNKSLSIKDSLIFSLMNSVFTGLNVWYLSNNERNRVVLCLICVAKHLVNMGKSRLSSCSLLIYFIIDHTQVMFIQTFFLAFFFFFLRSVSCIPNLSGLVFFLLLCLRCSSISFIFRIIYHNWFIYLWHHSSLWSAYINFHNLVVSKWASVLEWQIYLIIFLHLFFC